MLITYLTYSLIVGLLSIAIYQDIKYRGVSWIIFPLLFLLFVITLVEENNIWIVLENFMVNLLFLTTIIACYGVWQYFKTPQKVKFNLTKNLGLGDILILLVVALLFSPVNFILFFELCLLLTIIGHVIIQKIYAGKQSIPLVSWLGSALIITIVISKIYAFNLHDDTPVLLLLY